MEVGDEMRDLTLHERIEKLERFASIVTDLYIHYTEEARRYGEMLTELVAVRDAVLVIPGLTEANALARESTRPTPPTDRESIRLTAEADAIKEKSTRRRNGDISGKLRT